jgi:hypothetical protein
MYPYLDIGAPFDATIDLFDPSDTYETATLGRMTQGRPDIWRATATSVLGCMLTPQRSKLSVDPRVAALTAVQLRARLGRQLSFLVGIHPRSYWRWRSINFEQVRDIVKALQRLGAQCVLFHHVADPVEAWAKDLAATAVIGEKPAVITEMVRLCDAMVTVDSGFFHLAGVLDVPAVGMFAQTDGDVTSREYSSCRGITAGATERAGLHCQFPCYRREAYGCNWSVCERGCRALYRISPKTVVDAVIKLVLERKGMHLSPEERNRRLLRSDYGMA